jgi:thiamine biosynthesis lipoprotein
MGVPFRIVVYATNNARAADAAEAAFARVSELNAILSDYDRDSEVSRLTHEATPGEPVAVSPELWLMLERSQRLARETGGAFDVTVGPLVNLWRRSRRRMELPPEHLLQEARSQVGWQRLHLEPRSRSATLQAPRMRLDFGGIAKGYAADEALRALRERNLPRALVAAAGDIAAGESPPGLPGWRIEIGQIDMTNAPPARQVWLRNAAVATSGDIFQRLEIGGVRYSHIVDPRTGIGLTDHSLVTVIAEDGITADSLATAVSVLGPEAGMALIERTPGAAALILRAPEGTIEVRESSRLARWLREPPLRPERSD